MSQSRLNNTVKSSEIPRKWVSLAELAELETIVENKTEAVAVDCEGVDLGRFGTLNLLTLATKDSIYLVDLFDIKRVPEKIKTVLRAILESTTIIKVLHGCQQDSDALQAHLGAYIQNVYDTQIADICYRQALSNSVSSDSYRSLNDTLETFGLPANKHKAQVNYRANPKYWATRPLTQEMIEYAVGDVLNLLPLYECQRELLIDEQVSLEQVMEGSLKRASEIRDSKYVDIVRVPMFCRSLVLGRQHQNLRQLQRKHNCGIFVRHRGFVIFTDSAQGMAATKAAIERLVEQAQRKVAEDDY